MTQLSRESVCRSVVSCPKNNRVLSQKKNREFYHDFPKMMVKSAFFAENDGKIGLFWFSKKP